MTHALPPAAFCPERRQALEREAEKLSSEHNRRSRRSSSLLVAGIAAYACGMILAAYDVPLFVSWSRLVFASRFVVLPKRWIVERTFAWISRCRRHSKDYERSTESSEAMINVTKIGLMSRRLAKSNYI